ncbi:F-box domain-containing protein [Mycena venus]|uniref:F-box domain-containing protein n=1 Tax=Mycena venus TaxID=2733690 RepID=A0A8H6YWB4_9AGAR|nr:F-box domain-containing protein [Mycena venus]
MRVAECRLDSLEELQLKYIERDVPNLKPIVFSTPRLRKLTMDLYPESQQIVVPWAQLTNLTLNDSHSPESALDILGRCPGLVQTSVSTVGWPQRPQAKTYYLALYHLRCLSLDFSREEPFFMSLLDYIFVPALEELCLDYGNTYRTPPWIEPHFTAFQQRSPHIARLELTYASLKSGDLKAVLQHARSLTHLKLNSCDDCFDDALIDALCYRNGAEPLVYTV